MNRLFRSATPGPLDRAGLLAFLLIYLAALGFLSLPADMLAALAR